MNAAGASAAEIEAAVMARQGKKEGGEIRFLCPCHDDHRPSARWNPEKRTWVCDARNVGGGMKDLAERLGVNGYAATRPERRILATYTYRDELGALLFEVLRYEPKKFVQRRPDGAGGWVWKLGDTRRVLYRLPELLAADPAETVYVCEGEKAADAVAGLGLVATCSPHGAGKWRAAYAEWLRGRHVVILPDNDEPGRQHARAVADSLQDVAASVQVVALPGLPEKGDAFDWREAGGTADQLTALMANVADVADSSGGGDTPAGAEVLDLVHAFLGGFVAYPSPHAHVAHTLWIAHAHLMDAWESTPRLAFLSPEPGSGKTRALEVTEPLVPRPVEAVNVTPAYLFRKVGGEGGRPTILYDEIDTVFGPKAKDHEEIRGLLNAGHRKGAVAGRCVVRGKLVETEEIPAYCAVALAGLGGLPDTILTRSVVVRMRRRAPDEQVEPYRRRLHVPAGNALRDMLAAWATSMRKQLGDPWPTMPEGIVDRDADVWEPLLAVADAAGGAWPVRARAAAVALVADSRVGTPSLNVRLLADLREVFGEAHVLATETILARLCALDEAPWSELVGGKPLNARGLAQRLNAYGVKSHTVRLDDGKTPKGYRRADLWDAWARYLPSPPEESATSATTDTEPPAAAAPATWSGELVL